MSAQRAPPQKRSCAVRLRRALFMRASPDDPARRRSLCHGPRCDLVEPEGRTQSAKERAGRREDFGQCALFATPRRSTLRTPWVHHRRRTLGAVP